MTGWAQCRDCKQPLTSAESMAIGYGRVCARKRGLTPPKRRRKPNRRRPAVVAPAPDALPGQDALPLFYLQPTFDSI